MVIEVASAMLANWEVRKLYKQDIILSLAVAYCNKARDMLSDEQVGLSEVARHAFVVQWAVGWDLAQ